MPSSGRTGILIVDDSAVVRSLLRSVIAGDPTLAVAGTASDGESALNAVALNQPDLILLDVEMPVMDGLSTLRRLRELGHKMPVIMCSSLTQRGAKVTIEALAAGASDYVAKPANQPGRDVAVRTLARELLPKIRGLCDSEQQRFAVPLTPRAGQSASAPLAAPAPLPLVSPRVMVVGVSTGGPAALDVFLPALPADLPLPVLVVQHMPEVFTKLFAERLNRRCRLRVREASEGELVAPGTIFIARGNWHLEVVAAARTGTSATLHLNQEPPENHCRPAVDALFRSAARIYGPGVLAVVLTGMGSDGLVGCRMIRSQGGLILVQNEATSTVWGMPGSVAQAGLAHRVLALDAIAPEVLKIAARARPSETPTRMAV